MNDPSLDSKLDVQSKMFVSSSRLLELWALALILVLAAGLRLARLDTLPPGLFLDEAFDGLDALRVLAGEHPLYFPGNNGREPMFMYLVAGSLFFFGRSPVAIRLVSAIASTVGVLGIFLVAREMFGRRVGLLAAALCAITLWPIQLGRLGIRPSLLLPFLAFALWQGTRAWKTRHLHHWALAGGILGLAFYTYTPVRLAPVALGTFAMCWLLRDVRRGRPVMRAFAPWFPGALIFVLVFTVTVAPLAYYTLNHWDVVISRTSQLSITNPEVNQGDWWGLFLKQVGQTAPMFFFRGDENPRHNVPLRPIFDPLTSVAFMLGMIIAVKRRHEPAIVLCAIWLAVMLLPALLAFENPHFLRTSGALPVIFVWPALGLEAAGEFVARRAKPWLGAALVSSVLLLGAASTIRDYFLGPYATGRELYLAFDAYASDLALEINRFLGVGWQGQGLAVHDAVPRLGRVVIIEDELWSSYPALSFLVPATPSPGSPVVLADFDQSPPIPALDPSSVEVKLFLVSGAEAILRDYLPRGVMLSATEGVYNTTPGQPATYSTYRVYTASRLDGPQGQLGCWGNVIILSAAHAQPITQGLEVELVWKAEQSPTRNYTVLVDALDESGNVLGQHTSPPSDGRLPTKWWRPGDFIRDTHRIILSPADQARARQLSIGMYRPATSEYLPVSAPPCFSWTGSGSALDDRLTLPLKSLAPDYLYTP